MNVESLYRYPVKSMAGERIDNASISECGISGDRGWAVMNPVLNRSINGRFTNLLNWKAAYTDGTQVAVTTPDLVALPFQKLCEKGASGAGSENEDSHSVEKLYHRRFVGCADVGSQVLRGARRCSIARQTIPEADDQASAARRVAG